MASTAYQALKNTSALPSPTGTAMELLRLVGDQKATLDAIAAVVEADPATAGRMLKLVNSSFAALPRKIASIPVAVKLLGLRTVRNLALSISLVSNHSKGRCKSFDYERFWSESLAKAVAARQIAGRFSALPLEEAFIAGLLEGIGVLALATARPEEYAHTIDAAGGEPAALLELERSAFGIDHHELAGEMLADWRVESSICNAVRCQGNLTDDQTPAGPSLADMAHTIHLASGFAGLLVQAQTQAPALAAVMDEAGHLGIPHDTVAGLFDSIGKEWRDTGVILSVTTRDVQSLEQLVAQAGADPLAAAQPETRVAPADACPDALRILVVDDDPAMLRLTTRHLTAAGHRVFTAANGQEALEVDRSQSVQMILTDWMMPKMDGIELCRRLRGHSNGEGFIYIIMLTARSVATRATEALNAGADDFLVKPFDREELLAHVRAGGRIVRLEADLAERSRQIALYNARLAAANDKLKALATTDELTGLANRREGLVRLAEHWSVSTRHHEPISCIVADIDHFKNVNDTYGHAVGDVILKETARLLKGTARAGDLVCRMGGEEFLIVCPKLTASAARVAAEHMRQAIASQAIHSGSTQWSVTVSMGVAERTHSMNGPQDLLKAADERLYAAKNGGRNRVCAAGAAADPAPPAENARGAGPSRSEAPIGDLRGLPVNVLLVDDDVDDRALELQVAPAGRVRGRRGVRWAGSPRQSRRLLTQRHRAGCQNARHGRSGVHPAAQNTSRNPGNPGHHAQRSYPRPKTSRRHWRRESTSTSPSRSGPGSSRCACVRWRASSEAGPNCCSAIRRAGNRRAPCNCCSTCRSGLSVSETLDSILERAVAAAAELARCRRISIMMPDAAGTHLVIAKSVGIDETVCRSVRVPVGQAIAGQVYASGGQEVVNHAEDVERRRSEYDCGLFVSAPLVSKALRATRRVVGVLNITDRHNSRPFEPAELESLNLLCNVTATAIDTLVSRQERDQAQNSIVVALATLAESRDPDTASHLDRVTQYALMLAQGASWPRAVCPADRPNVPIGHRPGDASARHRQSDSARPHSAQAGPAHERRNEADERAYRRWRLNRSIHQRAHPQRGFPADGRGDRPEPPRVVEWRRVPVGNERPGYTSFRADRRGGRRI